MAIPLDTPITQMVFHGAPLPATSVMADASHNPNTHFLVPTVGLAHKRTVLPLVPFPPRFTRTSSAQRRAFSQRRVAGPKPSKSSRNNPHLFFTGSLKSQPLSTVFLSQSLRHSVYRHITQMTGTGAGAGAGADTVSGPPLRDAQPPSRAARHCPSPNRRWLCQMDAGYCCWLCKPSFRPSGLLSNPLLRPFMRLPARPFTRFPAMLPGPRLLRRLVRSRPPPRGAPRPPRLPLWLPSTPTPFLMPRLPSSSPRLSPASRRWWRDAR